MKIAIIGTHGVGKTTLASQLFTYCTKNSKSARLIHEIVRDCPFGIHDEQTIDTVSWIIAKQIGLELDALAKKPEFIICDRSSIDPMMYWYARVGVKLDEFAQNLSDLAHSWLYTYDVIILVTPSDRPIEPDGFRSTDVAFQKAVDAEFAISTEDFKKNYPSKQFYTISSKSIFEMDLSEFFQNIVEGK